MDKKSKQNGAGTLAPHSIRYDLVVFRLAAQRYALNVATVVEVLHMVMMTEVPNPPPGMLGVINYRGRVVPLIELRRVFGMASQKVQVNTFVLVVDIDDTRLALLVDSVDNVESLNVMLEGADEYISGKHHFISGVTELDEEMVIVLDLAMLRARFLEVVQQVMEEAEAAAMEAEAAAMEAEAAAAEAQTAKKESPRRRPAKRKPEE